ncbi:MAG: heparinase II/III family protein, partial [Spirochaetia bacterium]|nr:heparinase II/III family protein [Spirochaetia bacterium]
MLDKVPHIIFFTTALVLLVILPLSAEVTPAIPNPSFEEIQPDGKLPKDWKLFGGGGATETGVSREIFHDGSISAFLKDDDLKISVGLESADLVTIPGSNHRASAYVKVAYGSVMIYLQFFDSAGKRIEKALKTVLISSNSDWAFISLSGKAPPEATRSRVLFYSPSTSTGLAYFDSVKFGPVSEEDLWNEKMAQLASASKGLPEPPLLVSTHPRLYVTPREIPRLKKSGFIPTENFLTQSNYSVNYISAVNITYQLPPKEERRTEVPPGFGEKTYVYWIAMSVRIREFLEGMALSYLTTGDMRYAARLKEYLEALSQWSSWSEHPNLWLEIAQISFGYVFALDAIYDELSEAERKRYENAYFRLGLLPIFSTGLREDETNGPAFQYSALGIGGLYLLGKSLPAKAFIDLAKRYTLFYLEKRLHSKNTEGIGYTGFVMHNLLIFADSLARVTGDRSLIDHPYAKEVFAQWILYSLAPGAASAAPFADYKGELGFSAQMDIIAANQKGGLASWIQKESGGDKDRSIQHFLYHDASLPVKTPDQMPTAKWFPNIGLVSMRSGWDNKATLLAFNSSGSEADHCHFDQNHFVLNLAGEWLLGDPGYRDTTAGWTAPMAPKWIFTVGTVGHNSVLVNGEGQIKRGGGKVQAFFHSSAFDYTVGDASAAYDPATLKKFDRHILFLRPSYYVICDDLAAPKPVDFQTLFHTDAKGKIETRDSRIQIKKKLGSLNIACLYPEKPEIKITTYPGAESYGSYAAVTPRANVESARNLYFLSPKRRLGDQRVTKILTAKLSPAESSGQEIKMVSPSPDDTAVFYRGRPGEKDFLAYEFTVPKDGRFELSSEYGRYHVYGIFKVAIDDADIGAAVDTYSKDLGTGISVHGELALKAGKHRVKYTMVGKNASSGNEYLALVSLNLKDLDAPVPASEESSEVVVKRFEGKDALGLTWEDHGLKGTVCFNPDSRQKSAVAGLMFSGKCAVLTAAPDGRKYFLFQGTSLREKDNLVVESEVPLT